jgi:hypothetical protein
MNSASQHKWTPLVWWKAVGLSIATVYAPFVVMAIYTLLFVPCHHCKTAVCTTLPLAPGLVVSWLLLARISNHMPAMALWILTGGVDMLVVVGLSFIMRRGGRWLVVGIVSMLVIASVLAVLTLALIRA